MIVGPIPAQMDDFCDLHGTPDTPVSRIVTVNVKNHICRRKIGFRNVQMKVSGTTLVITSFDQF